MNKYGSFKCASCGSEDIKLDLGDDGLDELSAAGRYSGFTVVVSLECQNCGRVYPVCRVRKFSDVSDLADPKR